MVMDTGCHEWIGAKSSGGYGQLSIDGRRHYVHRLAYELANGKIPAGLVIDHLCRNRACINPGHLETVTNEENVRRGSVRTECLRGHEYNASNTYVRRNGWRVCRVCAREKWALR